MQNEISKIKALTCPFSLGIALLILGGFCLVALWVSGYWSENGVQMGVLNPDSDQYLQLAYEILGKKYSPLFYNGENYVNGQEIRAPLYPIILASGLVVLDSLSGSTIFLTHLFCLLVAAFALLIRCGKKVNTWVAAGAIVLGAIVTYKNLILLTTEWSTFCFLLMWCAVCMSFIEKRSLSNVFMMGLISAALAMLRAEYILLVVYSAIIIVMYERPIRFFKVLFYLAGISPLLLYSFFNFTRFNEFSASPTQGHIIGIATVLTNIPIDGNNDLTESRAEIAHINRVKQNINSKDWKELALLINGELTNKVATNIGKAQEILSGQSWLEKNRLMFQLGIRTIKHVLPRYFMFVFVSCLPVLYTLPLFLLIKPTHSRLALCAMLIGTFHILRIAAVSAVIHNASTLLCS
ncbi:MAG: hypothetical protein GYA55_11645 [SAR324 cluster bacterium]|uniref:Uncharacterized protein n=1 Tax=SAR324 cluster bacterium TaxID=2024889 RepID=A0A7X9IL28_9DELT|nr:hypothetical protein [SAR324 cluster bacterium]